MDTKQLNLLARRLSGVLELHNHPVKHGQALDLAAALVGLRNWPEVMAFPDEVAATELTEKSTKRLVERIHSRMGLRLEPRALLAELRQQAKAESNDKKPAVWPEGPAPGLYVTTSPEAIEALVGRYAVSTGDAAYYAERGCLQTESAIDLGDGGVFSGGLLRLPSGTLFLLGRIELSQECWEDNCDRLRAAALLVLQAGHRVALLCETPNHEALHNDLILNIRWLDSDTADLEEAFAGTVTADGNLVPVAPFCAPRPSPLHVSPRTIVDLPDRLADLLHRGVARRKHGVLLLSGAANRDESAPVLEASLRWTEAAGPAVRIQPTFGSDYSSKPPLSARFAGLPTFPSIESAYAGGYRRMVLENAYNTGSGVANRVDDVCFIVGGFHGDAGSQYLRASAYLRLDTEPTTESFIAILTAARIQTKRGLFWLCDGFVPDERTLTPSNPNELWERIRDSRQIRWEDELNAMLDRGDITTADVRGKVMLRHELEEQLTLRRKAKRSTHRHRSLN